MRGQPSKHRVGCLMPLAIYIVAVIMMYVITRPQEVTSDFTGRTARMFSVAVVDQSNEDIPYRRTSLETTGERDDITPALHYLLPEERIVINDGDIHTVRVVEKHDDWQLIEFNYSNSYTARSIYKAFSNRVEPVSFQITSSIGQAFLAVPLIVLAWCVAWVITIVRNRRASRRASMETDDADTS